MSEDYTYQPIETVTIRREELAQLQQSAKSIEAALLEAQQRIAELEQQLVFGNTEIGTITGLVITATITVSVAADKLASLQEDYPETAHYLAALVDCVQQLTAAVNLVQPLVAGRAEL